MSCLFLVVVVAVYIRRVTGRLHVLRVFIASPGDVPQERSVVVDICREVSHEVGSAFGWTIQADGWELTRPGLGRAQDRINPLVDACDVLVGVLHRRWGTPTGEFTSGFHEEVERVKARREDGEPVDAMIYLRALPSGEEEPPEASAAAFREQIKGWALYCSYEDVADFRSALKGHLTSVLSERIAHEVAREQGAVSSAHAVGPVDTAELPAGDPPAPEDDQGAADARAALQLLAAGLTPGSQEPGAATVVRAHLAATAQISATSGSVMDVHDLLRAYDLRDDLAPLAAFEQRLVARTIASDEDQSPGWGLLGDDTQLETMAIIALGDRRPQVQAGALRQIGAAGFDELLADRPANTQDILGHLCDSEHEAVITAACDVLAAGPFPDAALILGVLSVDGRPSTYKARRSLLDLLLRTDPSAAASLLASGEHLLTEDAAERLTARAADVDRDAVDALGDGGRKARALRLAVLGGSGRLTDEHLREGLCSDDVTVRLGAVRAALAASLPLTEDDVRSPTRGENRIILIPDDIQAAWLATRSTDELLGRARYGEIGLSGALAMRELLRRGHTASLAAAREDLRGDLTVRRDAALKARIERMLAARERTDEEAAALETVIADSEKEYRSLHESLWRAALLEGLSAHPEPSDADLARTHLDSGDSNVSDAAARLLIKTGGVEDIEALIAYADASSTSAEAILEWAAGLANTGEDLLDIAEAHGVAAWKQAPIVDAIRRAGKTLRDETLDHLLQNARPELRAAALRVAVGDGERASAIRWLVRAEGFTTRYFDVVAVLDRLAYGPDSAAALARARLEAGT